MGNIRVIGALALSALCACDEAATPPAPLVAASERVTTTSASAAVAAVAPQAARVDVRGKVGDEALALRGGVARWTNDGLEVHLGEVTCDAPHGALTFTLLPGPQAKLYAGGTIARPAFLGQVWLPASAALISVTRARADRVEGSLRLLGRSILGDATAVDAAGSFAVPICGPDTSKTPRGIPEGDGAPTRITSALAYRERTAPPDTIDEIWLFHDASPSCSVNRKPNAYAFTVLSDIGRSSLGGVDAVGPQPARVSVHPAAPDDLATGGSAFPDGEAAITWTSLAPRVGGVVSGTVRASSRSGPNGAFTARVCP